MNKNIILYSLLAVISIGLASCEKILEKDYDTPPGHNIPEGFILDISDLRQILSDSGTYKFTEDYNIFVTVTADGTSGNFYKNVFIQDSTDALNMRTIEPGGLYTGDYIRVNLNGAIVSQYEEMLQLDSVDVNEQVVIQANQQYVTPMLVTLDEIGPDIQARLVTIENVEFSSDELGQNYADAVNLSSVNRILKDCDENEMILRSSGYSSFAGTQVPGRNGTITAIVGQFGSTMQLMIRGLEDVQFDSLRCDGTTGEFVLFKNFEDDDVSSGGWTQEIVTGTDSWGTAAFGGNIWGRISNYDGSGNNPSEAWLISPSLDLTSLSSPALSFLTTTNYDGPVLQTFVSTDYGTVMDVQNATWTELSATYSPTDGGWEDTESGIIDLSTYSSANTYIGFRYTGSSNDGATWELDNIAVFEN